MPDFDTFWNGTGIVEFPIAEENKKFVRYAKFREDPQLQPLGTPSGLIEIYSKNIQKMGYDDCPPHPTWMEPIGTAGRHRHEVSAAHRCASHPQCRHALAARRDQAARRRTASPAVNRV